MRSPVWISGMGAISSAGVNVSATLDSFHAGTRHSADHFPFETSLHCPSFLVRHDLPVLHGPAGDSRTLRLAMVAVCEALDRANIVPGIACQRIAHVHSASEVSAESAERRVRPIALAPQTRVGICMGTTVGCQLSSVPFYASWRKHENPSLQPVYSFLNANLGQALGKLLGVNGPRMTVVNACSSGTDAIGIAASWIRHGLCDIAIAGGADEMYQVPVAGFWSLGVMSKQLCAPFDRDRSGLNLGEGAGVVVLESDAFCRANRRTHLLQVAGYGAACDAYHLTAPHPDGRGLDAAIRTALGQAEISTSDIAFINSHGTATLDNDKTEGKVIERLFGQHTPFLSTKGYTGHTLGAAGGLEAVFTLLGLSEGWVPGSAGFVNAAHDIPVTPIRERTAISGEYALSTSLAFGGNNAAVVFRRGK